MNPNVGMANMAAMGGPVGGAPVPMMNNAGINPQAASAASANRQQQADNQRAVLNTYIYEYFIRYGMYDCARSLLSSDGQVNVLKDGGKVSHAVNGVGDDPMDSDSKDDLDSKLPEDLPAPKLPMTSDTSFLYEWFCLFWDIYNAQRAKSGNGNVNQYVSHTQQMSRFNQKQQQELLRQMRPDMAQAPYSQMMRMPNGAMGMGIKQGNLARAAIANNQNNPQMQMLQQAKQHQMQRDPSGMDANRDRPASPASGENAPSPSKRQRIDNAPFNPNQPGGMMPNGRPAQGMPGQQMPGGPNAAAAHQMLAANGINPNQLGPQQFQQFHHQGNQMGSKQMPNAAGPPGQGSPMMPQGPDGSTLSTFYNPGEMGGPGGLRPGPGGAQAAGGSNHALQDYQMQLMLLEQQNKKRLMMARQEQDSTMGGLPREGGPNPGPGGPVPTGPNGQPFPETSPQAMRSGASPNPTDQMKRGTPQMNNSGIPSPAGEAGPQSRGSPNPAMNFMGNNIDPNMAPHFFIGKDGMTAANAAQMNGMRPPSSHPGGQQFGSQMNPQMMAGRQQQQQGGQANSQGWQQGPNGQMIPQGMPQGQQIQGTPQRSMPPPSAPAAVGGNNRTTASPQQSTAAPPTPSQGNKAAPKKKEPKNAKKQTANSKKGGQNANNAGATPASENNGESEGNQPATPMTPVNSGGFNKSGPAGTVPNGQASNAPNVQATTSGPPGGPVAPPQGHDSAQNGSISMDNFGSMVDLGNMELPNSFHGDVLNDFDFDSFLHDGDGDNQPFDFNGAFSSIEGNEIGAD